MTDIPHTARAPADLTNDQLLEEAVALAVRPGVLDRDQLSRRTNLEGEIRRRALDLRLNALVHDATVAAVAGRRTA